MLQKSNNTTFDPNGNILEANRNGNFIGGSNPMDNLTYYYKLSGGGTYQWSYNTSTHLNDLPSDATNQLDHVDETASGTASYTGDVEDQGATNYTYDAIGNLESDLQEEIANIEWTVFGKIRKITRTSTSDKPDLEFRYNAMGNRICKIVKPKDPVTHLVLDQREWTYTYYAHDASGNVMAVYDRDLSDNGSNVDDKITLKEQDLYASSRVGLKRPLNDNGSAIVVGGFTFTPGTPGADGIIPVSATVGSISASNLPSGMRWMTRKEYELSNHLGNVYAVVSDKKIGIANSITTTSVAYYTADVISATDYFAFGAPENGREFSSTDYRYGFNGKENDPEAVSTGEGTQDYGMRIYNPGLGRFLSVDPLTDNYPWYTPYQFAGNSPVRFIDLDGMELYDPQSGQTGPWSFQYVDQQNQNIYPGHTNDQVVEANRIATSLFDPTRNKFLPMEKLNDAVNNIAKTNPQLIYGPGNNGPQEFGFTENANGDLEIYDPKLEAFRDLVFNIYNDCQISDAVGGYFKYNDLIAGASTNSDKARIIRERCIEETKQLQFFNFIVDQSIDVVLMGAFTPMFEPMAIEPRLTLPKPNYSVEDYISNPSLLNGKSLEEVQADLGTLPENWEAGSLKGQGHRGQGWAIREIGSNGKETGRMIRYHPGSLREGHFGNGRPYWTVTSGPGGKTQWIAK